MTDTGSHLAAWNDEVLGRLRTAPHGTRWILQSRIGTGKTRVIALAARAWRTTGQTRTLIVAPRTLAMNLAEQIDEQATTRWLSKTVLRGGADIAFDAPADLLAATSPEALTDDWAVDVLSNVRWDTVIVDLDATRGPAIEPLALLASRQPDARLVAFSSAPGSEEAAARLGLIPLRFGSTLPPELYEPEPWVLERFHAAVFERSHQEQAILEGVDAAVAEAGPLARRLGLLDVQTAASSSFYAMQASALAALARLRETRNVLVHEGLASEQRASNEEAIATATLIRAFASLERMAAQVDDLEFDSRQDALVRLVTQPAIVDRSGPTVVFCATTATAEYIDHGLRLLGVDNATLAALRRGEMRLDQWLDVPGSILVLADAQLKGLDLTGAQQVINYDLPGSPERLAIRLTRLRWTPRAWQFWTLLPAYGQLSERERAALEWGPYLAARPRPVT